MYVYGWLHRNAVKQDCDTVELLLFPIVKSAKCKEFKHFNGKILPEGW